MKIISLQELIRMELNKRCVENESNTPDFLLAEYLIDCLKAWNKITKKRDKWYGIHLEPGNKYFLKEG